MSPTTEILAPVTAAPFAFRTISRHGWICPTGDRDGGGVIATRKSPCLERTVVDVADRLRVTRVRDAAIAARSAGSRPPKKSADVSGAGISGVIVSLASSRAICSYSVD